MSISFDNDMGPEAQSMIKEMFDVAAIDERTALLEKMEGTLKSPFNRKQMGDVARAAKQPMTLEINKIGDRKEVGGVVYELDEKGWRRLPIGTGL
ncbi:MAG: hypothetical protein AB2754_15950 [Candidatus Thiodiazotropha endolucinida]